MDDSRLLSVLSVAFLVVSLLVLAVAAVVCLVRAPGRPGRLAAGGFLAWALSPLVWLLFGLLGDDDSIVAPYVVTQGLALVLSATGAALLVLAVLAERGTAPRDDARPEPLSPTLPGPDA